MAFRVYCPTCGKVAAIESSNKMDSQFKQAYCSCTDPECGHSFVMNIEFSHTISPSAHIFPKNVLKRISETPPSEQLTLFQNEEAPD